MQGQRGAVGSFSETLGFEHGSTSSDAGGVDQQICWENNLQNSPSNRLSDYISLNSANQEEQDVSLWNVGEPSAGVLSLNAHANNGHHGSLFPPGSHPPHNATVNPSTSIGFKSSSSLEAYRASTSSSSAFYEPYELDDRHLSRKRKASEISGGQSSSGIGGSNMFQGTEGSSSTWHGIPENALVANANLSDEIIPRLGLSVGGASSQNHLVENGQSSSGIGSSNVFRGTEGGSSTWHLIPENALVANDNRSDEIIPRLGLSVGGASSQNHPVENGHRNVQLRISSSQQQDPLPATSNNRQSGVSAPYPSLRLNPIDFRSPPFAPTPDNSSSHQGQPVRIPTLRRNFQSTSRWSRNSSSRANRTAFNLVMSGDRNELDSISDHPLFAQPSNTQTELNWNSNSNGSGAVTVSNAGNSVVAASSRAGPTSGTTPSSASPNSVAHRSSQRYNPRRLSAFLRRTLSVTDLESGGGPNSNLLPRIPPSVSTSASASRDVGLPPVVGIQGPYQPHSRSSVLFGRQLEGAFGFPHLSRSMASGSEGRGRLVSEIRNVLDLMRRGEPLRFEDLMILDQSVFYGIADIHDRHRDMRLDIDNMSYEELLALEERIGNVSTGLTEEVISKHLKQKQYETETGQPDAEPCCICQEEYNDGDDLGKLECGHEFHLGCIKQWLQHKNLCPICKSTGFTTT